ncbi:hypothetical protein YTPLAS18_05880 [Nitrospira sp.]|nr:hypothetical protein YTPLAS18_05880 [Nitrospira sp.]
MFPLRFCLIILVLGLLPGCATPPEVKEALRTKDQAYSDNVQLMDQYRELLENVDTRFEYWQRLIESRLKLSLALKWATTDPGAGDPAEKQQLLADEVATQLGPDVMKLVNKVRLAKLPARSGASTPDLFRKGEGTMTGVIQTLPALAATIDEAIAADYRNTVKPLDAAAYDDYRTNVAALRRLNGTVREYLEVDLTTDRRNVTELAEALRGLNR